MNATNAIKAMNGMAPSVRVQDLCVDYQGTRVLERLSLDIGVGEFVVLLGPSGCGKSTLLNAIAGLIEVSGGAIAIAGQNVTGKPPKDRNIGMVFQSYALYPQMTVLENLSFGLKCAKTPRAEIARRVDNAARILQLGPLLKRRPAELSGGQRQRVAIGRALVREVDVFLFDEPLSNLDAKLRAELRVEIKQIHQRLGNTMVYVTHDQVEALTLADRVAVMNGGRIEQLGAPMEIYGRPVNRFVAGFVGSPAMNFIDGLVVEDGGNLGFRLHGHEIDLAGYRRSGDLPDRETPATLGIRPEQLRLSASPPGAGGFSGQVKVLEPMGADTLVWVEWGERLISVRVLSAQSPALGEAVTVLIDPGQASLFAATTGDRL